MEWQDLFGTYQLPAVPLPTERIYHLQDDNMSYPETRLNNLATPIPRVVHHLCKLGLSQQSVALDHPTDNTQEIVYQAYSNMITKHRGAVEGMREILLTDEIGLG